MSTEPQRRYRAYVKSADGEIDTDRRDILNTLLDHARGYEERLSARDLAEKTDINDSTVRDVIIELREEFGVPIANIGTGYFVVESDAELESVRDYYEGEIETKRKRLQTIQRTYENHTPMRSNTNRTDTEDSPPPIRHAIRDVVGDGSVPTGELLNEVSDRAACETETVREELETLERNGFAYVVNEEVRLP